MTLRCPTCSHVLDADGVPERSIAERTVALLVSASPRPVAAGEIARTLQVQRTSVYQSLRRMADRGAIRRAVIQGHSGWTIVPQELPNASGMDQEGRRMAKALEGLIGYVDSVDSLGLDSALRYLSHLLPDLERDDARSMIASCRSLVLGEDDQLTVIPEHRLRDEG